MQNLQENEIIVLAQKGNAQAITKLYNKYFPQIKGIIKSRFSNYRDTQAVDDVAQEAMVKILNNLHKFEPKRKFFTWASRIAINLSIDYFRKMKKDLGTISMDKTYNSDEEGGENTLSLLIKDNNRIADDSMIHQEDLAEIKAILKKELSGEQMMLVDMRYFNEMSYKEICDELGLGMNTLKGKMFKIHKKLLVNPELSTIKKELA